MTDQTVHPGMVEPAAIAQTLASPTPQPPQNPLLARARMPGQTFRLPSGAVFYDRGEVTEETRVNGEVVVYPMVTLDEMIMKSPDKILNGTAMEEVFSRCIPQVKHPMMMLAKDIDYLMICLRRVTYGDEYTIEYTHDCENAKKHTYVVPLAKLVNEVKKLDVEKARKQYSLVLPNQQVVVLSPPKYREMLELFQTIDNAQSDEQDFANQVITATVSVIDSVDGIDDKQMIREWATALSSGYITLIGKKVGELGEWGPNLKKKFKCRDCGKMMSLEVSLNPVSFFS